MNYYESLRSLDDHDMYYQIRHLTPEDRADIAAYAHEMNMPGDIDRQLWCAWIDMLEARDR